MHCGDDALTLGLTEGDEPYRGGDEVRNEGVQIKLHSLTLRTFMGPCGEAHSDRIGVRCRITAPCLSHCRAEGRSLRLGFQRAFF